MSFETLLMEAGESRYGAGAFASIMGSFQALQPHMQTPEDCLRALVQTADSASLKQRKKALGISSVKPFSDTDIIRVGPQLAKSLREYAERVREQSQTRQVPVEPSDLEYFVLETLANARLIYRKPAGLVPSLGRRPYTGQTEQPGENPGHYSWS